MRKIGLLVNPIAGMGGSVGLKGTDGLAEEAARRGALPRAPLRAEAALQALRPLREDLSVLCAAGAMGESEALAQGFSVQTVYAPEPSTTSRETPSWANMDIRRTPYSSEVDVMLVDMRQYLNISFPSNSAVLILVFPISIVRIMPVLSFRSSAPFSAPRPLRR